MTSTPEEDHIKQYLGMQNERYEWRASTAVMTKEGVLPQTDGVVGSYIAQEKFPYDDNILKHFKGDTQEASILEYGCGPGRNLLRLAPRFKKVAGVDISDKNIRNSSILLHNLNGYKHVDLYTTPGDSIPVKDNVFDVIFEVICMQHICSYTIRKRILTDMARVCAPGGMVVCQFGFNFDLPTKPGPHFRPGAYLYVDYYADQLLGVKETNGSSDCCVTDDNQLIKDFEDIGLTVEEVWHTDYVMDENHDNWVWICGRKPL